MSAIQESESVVISDDDMRVLVFIAGYVGRKVKLACNCTSCINEIVSQNQMACDIASDHLVYTSALDRGGLTWPNQTLVDVVVKIFMIFQRLLSTKYEKQFVNMPKHKALAIYLCMEMLKLQPGMDSKCECGRSQMNLYKLCAVKMTNILLNNYCKRLNDDAASAKATAQKDKKSRKLATLQNKK